MLKAVHGWIAYLVAFAAIFGTNLLPAFGPPTWTLLVLLKFNTDLPVAALVVVGAVAAAGGRFLLGSGSARFRGRFSEERIARLEQEREFLERDRRWAFGSLAVFLLSPLPSAQLFVAAGLLRIPEFRAERRRAPARGARPRTLAFTRARRRERALSG